MKVDIDERPDREETLIPRDVKRPRSRGSRILRGLAILAITLAALAALVTSGILQRLKARKQLQAETAELAMRQVVVIHPRRASSAQEVVLPANIQAYIEAPIYARTNGYLKHWYADIGTHVKSGQLLAEIDTPELTDQIQQVRADLATAEANYRLAEITDARYRELLKTNSVSQQDADNAAGNFDARKTAVDSARFNVKRLESLQSFNKLYAPFDGVLTARNTDEGALVDSGSAGGPARELFHVASTQKLRVFINVPQTYSQAAKPGLPVEITVAEFPGRKFRGTLVRTANVIDASARTLLSEVDMDNTDGALLPGAYGEAHLKLSAAIPASVVPVNTLLFRSEGLQVGTVVDGKILLKHVTLGRDFGNEVEVISGLEGDEAIVTNPSDSLAAGERVEIMQAPGKQENK